MEGIRNEDFFSYMLAQVLSVRVFLLISRVWHQLEKKKNRTLYSVAEVQRGVLSLLCNMFY